MANALKTYTKENGGRVSLLFLLFLLAIYEFITAGFSAFAVVCLTPLLALFVLAAFHFRMFTFWALIIINYFLQVKGLHLPFPMSLPNELLEIILLSLAIIDVKNSHFERTANMMLYALFIWCGFCTLQVLNDTCNIGLDLGAWYTGARLMAFQIMYAFLVYSIYISKPDILIKYLLLWGVLALFASFWVWKQKNIGFTNAENAWIQGRGRLTHILQGGSLIRYFSIYSDAANFGIGIASTAVAFIIFGITSKIIKYKLFFLITGFACAWAMFPSGTRTAIACLMAGFITYIFLSKSTKIAIPFSIVFAFFVFILVFTKIGDGNAQIHRMRTAFDKNDASAGTRYYNQQVMKKYLKDAPWGIGIAQGYGSVPANNKYTLMSTIPADSEYVYIWVRTGIIGITTFLICTAIMLLGACWIVLFRLRSPSLRGIGAGMCCAFVSFQLGGYGNQVLMQFPNCLVFYGGLTIVYVLPFIENEWIEYENKQLAIQEEKKRLKLEKKRASRVKL
ncbi:MAG: O-antigen ligase family protein [Prevotella sp.]|nr:O-antigen ligase family protein [Prevotella sp.]